MVHLFRCLAVVPAFVIATLMSTWMSSSALAQDEIGFNVNQFNPAIRTTDGFMANGANDQGHLTFGALFHLDYAKSPLAFSAINGGGNGSGDVIANQVSSRLMISFGLFDRIVMFAGFKFHLLMDGDNTTALSIPDADGAGVGDAMVGARFRLHGQEDSGFQAAFQARLGLPLGEQLREEQTYGGERSLVGWPEFIFQFNTEPVTIIANVGARLRKLQQFGGINIGHELTWTLGAIVPLADEQVDLIAELFGSTRMAKFFGREETPLEVLAGAKYHFGPGLTLGGGLSVGLTKGYGSPDVRVFALLGFEQPSDDEEFYEEDFEEPDDLDESEFDPPAHEEPADSPAQESPATDESVDEATIGS